MAQSSAVALSQARQRASLARMGAAADVRLATAKNKLKEERVTAKSESLMAGVGAHAFAVVGGQVAAQLGIARERPGLARGINYGAGLFGVWLAVNGKKEARVIGASMIGMSCAQLAIDTMTFDLVPGFNMEDKTDEEEGA